MQKIVTISLNPALDSASDVALVMPDRKLRCVNPRLEAGGGGVNVSRAIALLGGQSRAFVALGGATGRLLAELLDDAGLDVQGFNGPGLTRQSTAILETSTGQQFRFGQPGPAWPAADSARALNEIEALLAPDMIVVATGSLPPEVPDDFYVALGARVRAAGAQMIVDTSGRAQKALLEKGHGLMQVLRMDRHESEQLAGHSLPTLEASAKFAHAIAMQGLAELVIMARGAEGSVFATPEGGFHCVAPKGKVVSKVGAGDSFVGGLALGLARGQGFEAAGKLATAAASAAVMTPGSALCAPEIVAKILPQTVLSRLTLRSDLP